MGGGQARGRLSEGGGQGNFVRLGKNEGGHRREAGGVLDHGRGGCEVCVGVPGEREGWLREKEEEEKENRAEFSLQRAVSMATPLLLLLPPIPVPELPIFAWVCC